MSDTQLDAWHKRWPNACPDCFAGGLVLGPDSEPLYDGPDGAPTDCPSCLAKGLCPRCAKQTMVAQDGEPDDYECTSCGWLSNEETTWHPLIGGALLEADTILDYEEMADELGNLAHIAGRLQNDVKLWSTLDEGDERVDPCRKRMNDRFTELKHIMAKLSETMLDNPW